MRAYEMPPHVVRHCQVVCGVALYLTRELAARGLNVDIELVRAAALLHDITKRHSFHRPLDHALTGSKLLRRLGYPEVAAVVRQHVVLSRDRQAGWIAEAEIVNYADKRVIEDRITTLQDRLAYIMERYGRRPEVAARIEKNARKIFRLEEEIFAILPGQPSQILTLDPDKERGK
jgi:putative nucleotidyltransferase with HDIG domain